MIHSSSWVGDSFQGTSLFFSFATIMFCYQQLIIDVRHKLTIMLCFKTYNKFIHIYFQSGAATMTFFFQLWWSIALLSIPVVRFFFCFLLFRSWSMAPLTSDKGAVLGEQSQGWKNTWGQEVEHVKQENKVKQQKAAGNERHSSDCLFKTSPFNFLWPVTYL